MKGGRTESELDEKVYFLEDEENPLSRGQKDSKEKLGLIKFASQICKIWRSNDVNIVHKPASRENGCCKLLIEEDRVVDSFGKVSLKDLFGWSTLM